MNDCLSLGLEKRSPKIGVAICKNWSETACEQVLIAISII